MPLELNMGLDIAAGNLDIDNRCREPKSGSEAGQV